VEWHWPTYLYYGGEVINTNLKSGNDTLKVQLYQETSDSEILIGDTSHFPLRYLVSGNKKAPATLNLTMNDDLVGTVSLEI
jgi:hypothetical protein